MASKFKPHKNPDQIAKKHGVSTEAILKQLKIGVPIEHEHTNDKELATNIALQHLGEFPDYYTRIKKMESQAKKSSKMSSKKLKEESSEKRFCALCNKKETRSECSYGGDMWDLVTKGKNIKEDHKEVASGKRKDEEGYMARLELDTIERSIGNLRRVIKKGDQQLPAWVQSKITRAADFIDTASEYLQSDEKVSEQKSLVDTIIDEIKEDCWKGYKQVGMKKKGKKIVPNCVPVSEDLDEATRLQAETGNILAVVLSWKGRYYSIRMFFPQTKVPSRNDINFEINKIYPGAKVVSHAVSDLPSESPLIRVSGGNFAKPGPSKNYVKPMGEDWQKVNRQDKTDGLSPEAVKAYRSENPGSKLQTAVTEKKPTGKRADRRKSFCRRMSGMKSKLTSAKTARDPDSRINKALRRWNCN